MNPTATLTPLFGALRLLLGLGLVACGGGAGPDGSVPDGSAADAASEGDTGIVDSGAADGAADSGAADGGAADGAADSGVDAAPEPCAVEGAMRTAACGMCGLAQELCEGGVWVQGTCLSQGSCAPGAVETETLAMCAERARICDDTCHWLSWTDTVPPHGECAPAERRRVVGSCSGTDRQIQVCDDTCGWVDDGACAAACSDRRTTPFDSEEVCVLEGMFFRGSATNPPAAARPQREVFVSSFLIDRFPVTNRRYRACQEAGGCTFWLGSEGAVALLNDDRLDWFVTGVNWLAAREFCEWDGRRLPTEAEWEKAMRGPSPRTNFYPYGDTVNCSYFPVQGCPASMPAPRWARAIHQYPMTQSFYGVDDMMGNGGEWVWDTWRSNYYYDDASLSDPQGPTPIGPNKSLRGGGAREFEYIDPLLTRVEYRSGRAQDEVVLPRPFPSLTGPPAPTVRCARDAFLAPVAP